MTERSREHHGANVSVLERWIAVEGARVAMTYGSDHTGHSGRGMYESEAPLDARREQIAAEARNAIFWDLAVPRDRVSVHCDHGWLTLTGSVERPYQRSAAEADVWRVPGVLGVTNAIAVAGKETRPAARAG